MKHLLILFFIFTLSVLQSLHATNTEQQADSSFVLRGRVLGSDTREPLPNASITVQKANVSSVTNQDGYFSRVPASTRNMQLIIHYLGYENKEIPVITLIGNPNNHITLSPSPIELSELLVVSGDGSNLVREALQRIPENYPADPNMMVAFYRESVKKGSNYISLVEAVLDVYKACTVLTATTRPDLYWPESHRHHLPGYVLLKFQGGISDP